MAEQEEVEREEESALIRWLENGGFADGNELPIVRRIIAERDAAVDLARAHEAEAWECRKEMTDMTAQNGLLLAEVKRLESELAALRAKLPKYANGEAFVPGVDHCWAYDRATGCRMAVSSSLRRIGGKWTSNYGDRFYATHEECKLMEANRD